jgi:hypothetical protein
MITIYCHSAKMCLSNNYWLFLVDRPLGASSRISRRVSDFSIGVGRALPHTALIDKVNT